MVHILSNSKSIANQFLAELRNVEVQNDRMRFRRNLERLGEVFAYEISKTFDYTETGVETPLGTANMNLSNDHVVLATILRAGLPLHQGLLNYFDNASNAFISAYRQHHKDGTFEINLGYVSCPNLEGKTLILVDPMLATGASMNITLNELYKLGKPKKVHIVTAVAAAAGFNYVKRLHPEADIWMGALDEELTARSYIVPGLGDAGDLAFGGKMQD